MCMEEGRGTHMLGIKLNTALVPFFFFFLVKNFKSGNGEGWYEDIPEQFTRGNMSHDELPEPRVSICCLLETQQAIACTPPL